jgi:hypothetical protein
VENKNKYYLIFCLVRKDCYVLTVIDSSSDVTQLPFFYSTEEDRLYHAKTLLRDLAEIPADWITLQYIKAINAFYYSVTGDPYKLNRDWVIWEDVSKIKNPYTHELLTKALNYYET